MESTIIYDGNILVGGDENLVCSITVDVEEDYSAFSSASSIPSITGPLLAISETPSSKNEIKKNNKNSKRSQKPSSQKKKMKRGVVSFQESHNQVYDNQHVYKEDLKQQWYNRQDYEAFKESTAQCAMEVMDASVTSSQQQQSLPRLESVLLSSSGSFTTSSTSYPQTLQHVYEACVKCQSETQGSVLTESEDVQLKTCLAKTPSRWGVERAAVRWIAVDRHYRRSAMLELVLEMQQTMGLLANGSSSSSNSSSSIFIDDGLDEVLRASCEALSRPSRLFARHLAQAAAE